MSDHDDAGATPSPPEPAGLLATWSVSPLRVPAALTPDTAAPEDPDVRSILALGSALLSYGLPAHRVEESVLRLACALGRTSSVFGLPTALMITVRDERGADTFTARAEPSTIDLARLDALHALVARVERKELTGAEVEAAIAAVLATPRRFRRWLELIAVALVALGGTLMLGGTIADSAASAGLGLVVGGLLWIGSVRPAVSRVAPIAGAVAVTAASCALGHLGLIEHPIVAAFAALFVLLPGMMLTLAMTELATGHLVSGTARSVGALVVFLQLGLGVLLGLRLGRVDLLSAEAIAPAELVPASLGALLLASGFAVLLSVRPRDFAHTFLVSALAFYVCRAAGDWLGPESGTLLAATAVGLYAHAFARRRGRPSSTLTLPGVAMLVPGSMGLLSVSAAALHDPTRAFDVGFQMIMIVIALSTGILLSAAALPPRTAM